MQPDLEKASPRPWKIFLSGSDGVIIFPNTGNKKEDMKFIAKVYGRDLAADQANAELIVLAVNAVENFDHLRLLAKVKEFLTVQDAAVGYWQSQFRNIIEGR